MVPRHASIADIRIIRAIAHTAWPVAYGSILSPAQLAYMLELMYSEAALREQMTVKGHRFIIAEDKGQPVGFAGFEHGTWASIARDCTSSTCCPERKALAWERSY